jgi:hypothetical protein
MSNDPKMNAAVVPATGHDGPCVGAGDACYWRCDWCLARQKAARAALATTEAR